MTTAVPGAACMSIPPSDYSRTIRRSVFGTGGLPFIVGAALTFVGGIALYYCSCLHQALLALDDYSHLMLLHLDGKQPTRRWDMSGVRAILDGRDNGWVGKSMIVTAWQSAGLALDVSSLNRR